MSGLHGTKLYYRMLTGEELERARAYDRKARDFYGDQNFPGEKTETDYEADRRRDIS